MAWKEWTARIESGDTDYRNWEWKTQEITLGANTGGFGDAEVYAVAGALGLAVEAVQKKEGNHNNWDYDVSWKRGRGRHDLERVRIYCDHRGMLEHLHAGAPIELGPIISTRLAVQDLFGRADWLAARSVEV